MSVVALCDETWLDGAAGLQIKEILKGIKQLKVPMK